MSRGVGYDPSVPFSDCVECGRMPFSTQCREYLKVRPFKNPGVRYRIPLPLTPFSRPCSWWPSKSRDSTLLYACFFNRSIRRKHSTYTSFFFCEPHRRLVDRSSTCDEVTHDVRYSTVGRRPEKYLGSAFHPPNIFFQGRGALLKYLDSSCLKPILALHQLYMVGSDYPFPLFPREGHDRPTWSEHGRYKYTPISWNVSGGGSVQSVPCTAEPSLKRTGESNELVVVPAKGWTKGLMMPALREENEAFLISSRI